VPSAPEPPSGGSAEPGDALLSPAVTRRLIGEFVARPPDAVAAAGMETLTSREREMVALVAHGLSNDEIADALASVAGKDCRSDFRRCHVRLGGVACFGEFGGSEDRDGKSDQDRAENPGDGQ
jgi:Bacterial regulatory proteins, luxR family